MKWGTFRESDVPLCFAAACCDATYTPGRPSAADKPISAHTQVPTFFSLPESLFFLATNSNTPPPPTTQAGPAITPSAPSVAATPPPAARRVGDAASVGVASGILVPTARYSQFSHRRPRALPSLLSENQTSTGGTHECATPAGGMRCDGSGRPTPTSTTTPSPSTTVTTDKAPKVCRMPSNALVSTSCNSQSGTDRCSERRGAHARAAAPASRASGKLAARRASPEHCFDAMFSPAAAAPHGVDTLSKGVREGGRAVGGGRRGCRQRARRRQCAGSGQIEAADTAASPFPP